MPPWIHQYMTMRAEPGGLTVAAAAEVSENDLRAELMRIHFDAHAWAVRCCRGDTNEAGDALHRAYVKVLEGAASYDGRSSFKTWFFGVVRRTVLEQRRQSWLRLVRLERWWQQRQTPNELDVLDEGSTALLRGMLAQLSKRQQEVLHLVFYQNLTIQEAAAVLALPIGTTRTHYERGKARLRALLEGQEVP